MILESLIPHTSGAQQTCASPTNEIASVSHSKLLMAITVPSIGPSSREGASTMSPNRLSTANKGVHDDSVINEIHLSAQSDATSSDATSQTKSKAKRRRAKRDGPPQLQFLVATDPSQFRDENAKRSVRSQAMIHWRHEEDKKKKRTGEKDRTAFSPQSYFDQAQFTATASPARQAQQSPWHSVSSTSDQSSSSTQLVELGSGRWQLTASDTVDYFPRFQQKAQTSADEVVIDYEESEIHEQRQLRTMIDGLTTFYNIGGTHDPFDVLPQFRNPHLDALYLSRNCKS